MIKIKRLRVAVVLSGMQRIPEKSQASVQQIANCYRTNVFCHCWENEPEINNYSFGRTLHFPIPTCPAKEILQKFDNIKYKVSKCSLHREYFDNLFSQIKNKNGKPHGASFSQFYSMNKADKLRREYEEENNMKFDVVMRIRFDTDIKTRLIFENFDLKKLHIPPCQYDFTETPRPGMCKGIHDQFAFGPSDLMTHYFDVYDKMIEIANIEDLRTSFCTHPILAQHLLNGKIPVERPNIDIRAHGE
jgi:hypothetical protein